MVLDAIEARVHAHLDPVRDLLGQLAARMAEGRIGGLESKGLEPALIAVLGAVPQVSVIALLEPDMRGMHVLPHRPGIPAELKYYGGDPGLAEAMDRARAATVPFWGDLYYAETVDLAFLNLYAPIHRGTEFFGMLAAGISVQELSEFLSELGEDEPVTFINTFILHDRNWVLAHPVLQIGSFPGLSDDQPLPAITQLGDPVLHDFWDRERRRETDPRYLGRFRAHSTEIGEDRYVFIYRELTDFGSSGWIIGTYFPVADIASQAERLVWIPVIAAGMLLVALIVAIVIGRALSRPMHRLADAAARVRNLELADVPALPRSLFREINEASGAFNSMIAGLKSFETYVPRSLVKQLIAEHGGAGVPSEERELTVLFTDIAGFTSIAETLPAAEIAAFLNEHFTLIGGCVQAEGGTIDKYIGDALMAFWGAPVAQSDTAQRACRAALAIRAAIEADNARRRAAGKPAVKVRIGIHTGRAVVGNIGLPGRINYTVVGDTVNASQRLESLGKEIDGAGADEVLILLSGATVAGLDDRFETAPVGRQAVKGRAEEIAVSKLLSRSDPPR